MKLKLRDYQSRAVQSIFDYWQNNNGEGYPIVVAPTGSGKSVIIAAFIIEAMRQFPDARIVVVSHVSEIIRQDYSKLKELWPQAPAGFYSAKIGKRQGHYPIVFCTINSVYQKANVLGLRHIMICDEAHMIQMELAGMYGAFIKELLAINPDMKIVGKTATDFRTASGLLTEGQGALFHKVVFEISLVELLEEGYLTPPMSKVSLIQADMKGVDIVQGEFSRKQMAEKFSKDEFIEAAIASDMRFFDGRKSIALFCPTREIADKVSITMTKNGIYCESLHGDVTPEDNEDRLERFRSGELRALASVEMIGTGVDIPNIDCVVLFFATKSPGKYCQTIGRGFRPLYATGYNLEEKQGRLDAIRNGNKKDFTVLDHGGNHRHGPLTAIDKPQPRQKGERYKTEKAKVRICEICRSAWPLEATICGVCEHPLKIERDPTANLEVEASHADIMGSAFLRGEKAEWFDVDDVRYKKHVKTGAGESLKITYHCGVMQFDEYMKLHTVNNLWHGIAPVSIDEAVKNALVSIRMPVKIQVSKQGKYFNIIRKDFTSLRKESDVIHPTQQEPSHIPA